jgi:hypothetical protein
MGEVKRSKRQCEDKSSTGKASCKQEDRGKESCESGKEGSC